MLARIETSKFNDAEDQKSSTFEKFFVDFDCRVLMPIALVLIAKLFLSNTKFNQFDSVCCFVLVLVILFIIFNLNKMSLETKDLTKLSSVLR